MFANQQTFASFFENIESNQWHYLIDSSEQSDSCFILLSSDKTAIEPSQDLLNALTALPIEAVAKVVPFAELSPAYALKVNTACQQVKCAIETHLTPNPSLEVNVFSNAPKINQPGLLLMDMDSTAIQIECIDEIARLAGVYDEVASVTKQAMQGALPFSDSLKKRVAKLEGVSLDLVNALKEKLPLMPGVEQLCHKLKNKGWKLAIASGGFVPFAEQVQTLLGLDAIHANTLEDDGEKLTGRVLGTIVDADEKARFLKAYAALQNIPLSQTIAMGDGANDLVMMEQSALGVAVHGKPLVAKTADVAINFGSLTQVLYFISLPEN